VTTTLPFLLHSLSFINLGHEHSSCDSQILKNEEDLYYINLDEYVLFFVWPEGLH
jgi:hypothetical protein